MEIIEISVTQFQKDNLAILSNFLLTVNDKKFDMTAFLSTEDFEGDMVINDVIKLYSKCGTVACAAGHGPLAGIEPKLEETWMRYVERVFTDDDLTFVWLFSVDWIDFDNTPKGAAARIDFFLENGGIPHNYIEMMSGEIALPYEVSEG